MFIQEAQMIRKEASKRSGVQQKQSFQKHDCRIFDFHQSIRVAELRARAMATISAEIGLSTAEMVGLKFDQIDWYTNQIALPGRAIKLTASGARCLREYHFERHDRSLLVFVTVTGLPLRMCLK
jgi:integrase